MTSISAKNQQQHDQLAALAKTSAGTNNSSTMLPPTNATHKMLSNTNVPLSW